MPNIIINEVTVEPQFNEPRHNENNPAAQT